MQINYAKLFNRPPHTAANVAVQGFHDLFRMMRKIFENKK